MKPVKGFPSYSVDHFGNVFSHHVNRYIVHQLNNKGYLRVSLWLDGKRYWRLLHRLVLLHYDPQFEELLDLPDSVEVDHINYQILDNHISNLRPVTRFENLSNRRYPRDPF